MPDARVRYRMSMPQPATHLVHIAVTVDEPPSLTVLRLPAWTPGSYMIREFARQIQAFRAVDAEGRPLPWRKTRKDTWSIEAGTTARLVAEFDVYAHELTVRTSDLDATHGFFNPANMLPDVLGRAGEPLEVAVEHPPAWHVQTGLRPTGTAADTFVAADYDELVDSPIHVGPDPVLTFTVDGKEHAIATWGRGNLNYERITADLRRVVEAERDLFGSLPYDRYVFMLLLTDGPRGGLEHRNSTAVMAHRFAFRPGRPYERALHTLAHEFFHTWNVKRIHPEALGPFDYGAENYTSLLWAMEGITDYYTSLLMRRGGLITPERYLESLGELISELAETPGRRLQSLEEASYDAWIKYYRPDEHSVNSAISYYGKGAVASLLLDLEMRRRTGNERSLDDLMHYLWERYGQPDIGIPEDGYEAALHEVAGGDWSDFFDRVIRSRDELAYDDALAVAGVELEWRADPNGPEVWLGLRTRNEAGRTKIASVLSDGPAWGTGISAGDELLALDGFRVDEAGLPDRLRDYHPGDTVSLACFRRDELVEARVTLAARPRTRATLRKVQTPTPEQRRVYEDWVRTPWDELASNAASAAS
ncbi:MAG: hypothetical protein QOF51_3741 [Chloroflexota bacterium]|jgi:predicted metalloprotease with PDZ domain|nr:hypothetical protein [Chloroflexota bacterium]